MEKKGGDNSGKIALIGVAGLALWLWMRNGKDSENVDLSSDNVYSPDSGGVNAGSSDLSDGGMSSNVNDGVYIEVDSKTSALELLDCMKGKTNVGWLEMGKLDGKQLQELAMSCGVVNAPEINSMNLYMYSIELQRRGIVR